MDIVNYFFSIQLSHLNKYILGIFYSRCGEDRLQHFFLYRDYISYKFYQTNIV